MCIHLVEGDLGTRVDAGNALRAGKNTRPQTAGEKLAAFGRIFKEYGSTLKIRAFRKHLAIYLLSFTGKDVYNTVFVFFCVYCLNVSSSLAGTLLSMSIVGLPVTLIAGIGIIRYGPSKLYVFAYSLMLLCLGASLPCTRSLR